HGEILVRAAHVYKAVWYELNVLPIADCPTLGVQINLGIGQQNSNLCLVVDSRLSDRTRGRLTGLGLADDFNRVGARRWIARAAVLYERQLHIRRGGEGIWCISIEGSRRNAGEGGICTTSDSGDTSAPACVPRRARSRS